MFGYPEIITYLLLIPVLLQIVLPLAMLIIWLIFNIPNFIVSKAVQEESTAESDERRRYPRIAGELIGAVIADKAGNVIGKVRNISTSGICAKRMD